MKKQLATSLLALSISTQVWAGQDNPCADLSDIQKMADCITSLQTKIQEQQEEIKNLRKEQQRICSGKTEAGNTAWVQYIDNGNGIYVDVDISECQFSSTPILTSSLAGNTRHWVTTGASSIYALLPNGFRIYLKHIETITPAKANKFQWHVNWIAVGN